jgi:hypothetical protein
MSKKCSQEMFYPSNYFAFKNLPKLTYNFGGGGGKTFLGSILLWSNEEQYKNQYKKKDFLYPIRLIQSPRI